MDIQGIGQSFTTYQPMRMRGMQGSNSGFDPSTIDAATIIGKEDANLDGVLTIDETRLSEDMFSNADTDADGQLTTEELEEMLSNPPPMMMNGMGGPPPPPMDAASIMDQEDTDEDGSISIKETSLAEEVFSELDTNQDGQISLEEFEAGMAEKQKDMKSSQSFSSNQTVTQDQIADAYRQAMESVMATFTEGSYTDSSLSKFLGAIV